MDMQYIMEIICAVMECVEIDLSVPCALEAVHFQLMMSANHRYVSQQ